MAGQNDNSLLIVYCTHVCRNQNEENIWTAVARASGDKCVVRDEPGILLGGSLFCETKQKDELEREQH